MQLVIVAWGTSTAVEFIPEVIIFRFSSTTFKLSAVDWIPHDTIPDVASLIIPFLITTDPYPLTTGIPGRGVFESIFDV